MAAKRKKTAPPPPPSPPPAQSDASDEDYSSSSSDEEQTVAQPTPAKTLQPTERDGKESESESDSDSGSESEPNPPTQTVSAPKKPSESEDSSNSEEEDEAEKLESPAEEPEPETSKKKLKLSAQVESPSNSKKKSIQRIWSSDDEMVLLRALSEYHARHGKLPSQKDYASFLSTIRGSINFPVTENQLFNKIRQMRYVYNQKIKKGSDVKFSNPNERAVFDACKSLFDGSNKTPKKEKVSLSGCVANGAAVVSGCGANGGAGVSGGGANGAAVVSGGGANGGAGVRSEPPKYLNLMWLIKDLNSRELFLTVEDVVARIGELRAKDLEAKAKNLRIDSIKLCTRKENLKSDYLAALSDDMVDD